MKILKRISAAPTSSTPPRYLRLLEIIPTPSTDPKVVDFLMDYGKKILGKSTVLCKDTPAFIANRVGVFSIMALLHSVSELDLTVDQIDRLTGPILGRPKSATFRTSDIVGIDTLVLVANGLKENTPEDESNALFKLPSYITHMLDNKWLGNKTKQGFYKKIKTKDGESQILSLNLNTLTYNPKEKVSFPTLTAAKPIANLSDRMKVLFGGKDKAGEFYRRIFTQLFAYSSHRIPEISDEIYRMDDAIRAGFGWEQGPFEAWDAIGFETGLAAIKDNNLTCAPWVYDMKKAGHASFYRIENDKKQYYDIPTQTYIEIPGQDTELRLSVLQKNHTLWENEECTIIDLGNGVINLGFHSKMNTIGAGILTGIHKAIDMAEAEYSALVISNEGDNFSAGANVGMIYMMAIEQEYEELDLAVRQFQNTVMRIRYSAIPVVAAPHGMTLGGGCEICMHADKVIAHSETYMGLVEFGVGLIPGGGGSKEFALRLSDSLHSGDIRTNAFRDRFLTIGQAKVSTSAYEAFDLGYMRSGIDEVIVSRDYHLAYAKQSALLMIEKGYTQPVERTDIKVLGQEAMGLVYSGANAMRSGHYMSTHDELISIKLGSVLAGGDLSEITDVSEQYLLDLERKAFLALCTERKTLERIQHILTKGKILRN